MTFCVADCTFLDIEEEQLKFSTPSSLVSAFIFGANGFSVVKAASVSEKWRDAISKKVLEKEIIKGNDSAIFDEHAPRFRLLNGQTLK